MKCHGCTHVPQGFEKHKGFPEKNAYDLGFMNKLAEYGMTKKAKNITKLLARAGTDLSGATSRDLKFLARRGFKGFTPEQVEALRAKGLLPSVEQELAGFNRGTENMLFGVGTKTPSMKSVVRTNVKGNSLTTTPHVDLNNGTGLIPDAYAPGTLAEREYRASMARHEAREWVRGNAQRAKGDGKLGSLQHLTSQVGVSHKPGVIYDERLFRSQLANRLGLRTRWDKLPTSEIGVDGTYNVRNLRDAYIGSQPLSTDFSLRKQWLSRMREFDARKERYMKSLMEGTASKHHNAEIQRNVEKIRAAFPGLDLSDRQIRFLMTLPKINRDLAIGNADFEKIMSVLKIHPGLRETASSMRDRILDRIDKSIIKRYKIPADKIDEYYFGGYMPSFQAGSELGRVANLPTREIATSEFLPHMKR